MWPRRKSPCPCMTHRNFYAKPKINNLCNSKDTHNRKIIYSRENKLPPLRSFNPSLVQKWTLFHTHTHKKETKKHNNKKSLIPKNDSFEVSFLSLFDKKERRNNKLTKQKRNIINISPVRSSYRHVCTVHVHEWNPLRHSRIYRSVIYISKKSIYLNFVGQQHRKK